MYCNFQKPSLSIFLTAFLVVFLQACNSGSSSPMKNNLNSTDLSDVYFYKSSAPLNSTLTECIQSKEIEDSCTLERLPLIGMEMERVTTQSVLNRLVVSHNWMGKRFEQVLNFIPNDLLQLFQSVTMVAIDDDIRPSFYWTMTGAIYLDPAYLWLSNEEKATINKKEDYRSNFGSELPYSFAWRYVNPLSEKYAYAFYNLNDTRTRTFSDITLNITRLLYHELAHANDFFPKERFAHLKNTTQGQGIVFIADNIKEWRLSNEIPHLTEKTMFDLANTVYGGSKATTQQKEDTADNVGLLFHGDHSNNLYSYVTQYEDFAMLTEAVMMKYHYNVEMEVGFVSIPKKTPSLCNDYIVGWGSRNRIGNNSVKNRAINVTNLLFPSLALTTFYNNIEDETFMRKNEGWCSNLSRSGDVVRSSKNNLSLFTPLRIDDFLPP